MGAVCACAGEFVERTFGVCWWPHVCAAAGAIVGGCGEIVEYGDDGVGVDMRESEGSDTWSVDDPAACAES